MYSTQGGGFHAGGVHGGSFHSGGAGYYGGAGGAGYHGGAHSGGACCASGEDVTACGVSCGGGGAGSGGLSYVGGGHGSYIQETTYKYVGCGGDFDVVRPRRDFTCIITSCCLSLLLLPLLLWLLSGLGTTSLPFDCERGFGNWEALWSMEQQDFCCTTVGRGCTTRPTTARPVILPTVPPTPFPTPAPTPPPTVRPIRPVPSGDPFNCAVDAQSSWAPEKRTWCCRVHHKGCPTQMPTAAPIIMPVLPPQPVLPVRPADPYNCADGFANWQAGWSVGKKSWCCKVHGKGCPPAAGGCGTTSLPYDCNAGFANWMAGWSVAKKAWCCNHGGKGCPPAAGGCA